MKKWIAILLLLGLGYVSLIFSINFIMVSVLIVTGIFMNPSLIISIGTIVFLIQFGIQFFILWLCYKGIKYLWESIRKKIETKN